MTKLFLKSDFQLIIDSVIIESEKYVIEFNAKRNASRIEFKNTFTIISLRIRYMHIHLITYCKIIERILTSPKKKWPLSLTRSVDEEMWNIISRR